MLESKAIQRYLGSSPRKMRLVIDLIRGRSVDEALSILHFSPKHAARLAEKVLRSAVSNIHNTDEGARLDAADLVVKTAFVDGGPVMKRVLPAPMGRAYQIRKRSNHVTIVIAQKAKKEKQAVKSKVAPAAKAAATTKATETPAPETKEK
jgi:large subunit ribosomal protein L22